MFTKDTRTETFLTQMGVDFRYTNNVTTTNLAKDWDKTNLGRPVPVRDDAVVEYAELMTSGSPAPAPILHETDCGYQVLDGVQRISAAVLTDSTRLAAYVVTCDSEDILSAIRVLANARLQGRPEPPEWTRRRAVEVLVVERGLSVSEVAKMGGWKPADIETIAQALGWGGAIQAIGGPELPDTMIAVIAKHTSKADLAASAKPAAAFLQTVKVAKFSAADAELHIRDFFAPVAKKTKRHKTLSERLDVFKNDPEVQVRVHGRKGTGLSPDVNLRRSMRSVVTVLEEIGQQSEPLLFVDEFFQLLNTIDKKLRAMATTHASPEAKSVKTPADMWSKQDE